MKTMAESEKSQSGHSGLQSFYLRTAKGEENKTAIPGLDFAERLLEEGVRVEETFPFRTPLWLPALFFPEPDLWEPSLT